MTSVIDPNAVPAEENTVDIDSAKLDAARSKWAVEAGLSSATDPAGAGVALLEPEAEQEPPTTLERDEAARRTEQRAGLLVQKVSGRYRSPITGFQLELRVDVDGNTPLGKLSGDYYTISGGVTSYFGSWTVDATTISATPTQVIIRGTARQTWSTTFTVATVSIPRTTILQPPAPATLRWSTPSGAIGATYVCGHESSAFRTVALEQDIESGVPSFTSYNTGSLPSGGPARALSTAGAYLEAGIQILGTGRDNIIATPANHVWNNASLHHAMETHFSRFRDVPQFKVWLLHAMRHSFGTGLRGIMFDQQGPQRQGCASFYQAISASTAQNLREQLYVNVHELGHCFNLFHSFHKDSMSPPLPKRLGALSWMNYPGNYQPGGSAPGGEAAFWGAFPFQFDRLELAHLRHGFRNEVIMGGNPFGTGAAMENQNLAIGEPTSTSLRLDIAAVPAHPMLGTPVVLEIRLTSQSEQYVHTSEQLHPKFGVVTVLIDRPRGDRFVHRPPVSACAEPELVPVHAGDNVAVSAYVGYDAVVGQVFEDPGTYHVQAVYATPDGNEVVSPRQTIRIGAPRTREEDDVAELLLTNDVGMVLTLKGTDSEYLAAGTAALETVLEKHPKNPNAVYADFALGINAAREFTRVAPDGTVDVRPRDMERAEKHLSAVISASKGDKGIDDLTVLDVMSRLAASYRIEGDTAAANRTSEDAVKLARSKHLPAHIADGLKK